jgi:hypothetical protein
MFATTIGSSLGPLRMSVGIVVTHWACVCGIAAKAVQPTIVHHCAPINVDAEWNDKRARSDHDCSRSSSKGSNIGHSDEVCSVITRHLRSKFAMAFLVSSGEVELKGGE